MPFAESQSLFFSFIQNAVLLKTLFMSPHAVYPTFILRTTSISHPPTAVTYDLRSPTPCTPHSFCVYHIYFTFSICYHLRSQVTHALYPTFILRTTSISHPPSAATYDLSGTENNLLSLAVFNKIETINNYTEFFVANYTLMLL